MAASHRMGGTYHLLGARAFPKLLSIVVPVCNEQEAIGHLRQRLDSLLAELPCAAEVWVINDGSTDHSLDLLVEWAQADRRIKVVALARNFGHQNAVTAGLDLAGGDAVVVMDADLQDPPEVVHDMLARYAEGYDVVYGQRLSREGDSLLKRLTAWGFYRFMRAFIHPDLPPDSGDFRLISRPCLDALRQMRETHRFLRGMVAWVGFPQTAVKFHRQRRIAGRTKYPLRRMLRFAWSAALSFSPVPLRISLALGVLVAVLGLCAGIWAIISWRLHETIPGWTSTFVLVCLVGGAILISNGILGEYVGRIFEETKGRPLYVVARTVNVDPASTTTVADDPGQGGAASADKPTLEQPVHVD